MTINSFCVTVSKDVVALSKDLVCANTCNFHLVKASGVVKLKEMLPSASVCNCGKKNAVSCRFFRMATDSRSSLTSSFKSGGKGGMGGVIICSITSPSALSSSIESFRITIEFSK